MLILRWAFGESFSAPTRRTLRLSIIVCLAIISAPWAQADSTVANEIRAQLEQVADRRDLQHRRYLQSVYTARDFQPVWTPAMARRLLAEVKSVENLGLDPHAYHALKLDTFLAPDRASALLDIYASDAWKHLLTDLYAGAANFKKLDPDWAAVRREDRSNDVFEQLSTNTDFAAEIEKAQPNAPAYRALLKAYGALRTLDKGAWITLTATTTLKPGDVGPAVTQLRARLIASGDMAGDVALATSTAYDPTMVETVKRFQVRHGLEPDAVVGKATYAALNTTIEQRRQQIRVNLERWRWLDEELGERHILVNIADFSLRLRQPDKPDWNTRVVVGKPYRHTPVFSDTLRYMVINPWWETPSSIAIKDKLPLIKKDPSYLSKNNYQVLKDGQVVSPSSVPWSSLNNSMQGYRLRQAPGPGNALGKVKFMFPNAFNVYLHDTPSKELFGSAQRNFSSGCVRVENPWYLVTELLSKEGFKDAELNALYTSTAERTIRLKTPWRVHIQYWTAWVDASGTLQFRDDIYRRDKPLARALD